MVANVKYHCAAAPEEQQECTASNTVVHRPFGLENGERISYVGGISTFLRTNFEWFLPLELEERQAASESCGYFKNLKESPSWV